MQCHFVTRGLVNTGNSCFINSPLQVSQSWASLCLRSCLCLGFIYLMANSMHGRNHHNVLLLSPAWCEWE